MAKKKATIQTKLDRIMATILNLASDIASSKKTAEVLAVAEKDLALCIAVYRADYDDDMEIARLWIEIENKLIVDRAVFHGYIQTSLIDQVEANENDKPKSKNSPK